jgi:hypothetical protein
MLQMGLGRPGGSWLSLAVLLARVGWPVHPSLARLLAMWLENGQTCAAPQGMDTHAVWVW